MVDQLFEHISHRLYKPFAASADMSITLPNGDLLWLVREGGRVARPLPS